MLMVAVAAVGIFLFRDHIVAYNGRWLIPGDLQADLATGELELRLHESGYIGRAKFFPLNRLRLRNFRIWTSEYYSNYGEPGEDPNQFYEIAGVDLLQDVKGYYPDGVFIWLPQFEQFGTFDADHGVMYLFPGVTWKDIRSNPSPYIDCMWYPEKVRCQLLRPWSDERCDDLQPQSPD